MTAQILFLIEDSERAYKMALDRLPHDDFTLSIYSYNVTRGVYSFSFRDNDDGTLRVIQISQKEVNK